MQGIWALLDGGSGEGVLGYRVCGSAVVIINRAIITQTGRTKSLIALTNFFIKTLLNRPEFPSAPTTILLAIVKSKLHFIRKVGLLKQPKEEALAQTDLARKS